LKLLALDTSTEYCSVALQMDEAVLSRHVLAGQGHSGMALAMVDELLAEGGVGLAELDGVAFGSGPGSFTGLRIACGVAQGLAFGADLPVAGISTLLALAEGSGADKAVACLDARMGEVYHGIYRRIGGCWEELSPPGLYAPADLPLPQGGGWTGCGNGFAQYGEALRGRHGDALAAVQGELYPRAEFIARLAVPVFAHGRGVAPEEALPVYIRDKVALKTCERT
jgi:tRNA threonylcarbamoyladenosine biosynthesis protein TsaB